MTTLYSVTTGQIDVILTPTPIFYPIHGIRQLHATDRILVEDNTRVRDKQTVPFGEWKSPITSDLIVASTIGLSQVQTDGNDVYWIESRPLEGGRNVIVRRSLNGALTDVNPPHLNA